MVTSSRSRHRERLHDPHPPSHYRTRLNDSVPSNGTLASHLPTPAPASTGNGRVNGAATRTADEVIWGAEGIALEAYGEASKRTVKQVYRLVEEKAIPIYRLRDTRNGPFFVHRSALRKIFKLD